MPMDPIIFGQHHPAQPTTGIAGVGVDLVGSPSPRTPSPLAGGCSSQSITTHGRGEQAKERLYFNAPLWVGDLEKQLAEQKCEVQPPPLPALLLSVG